MLIRDGWDEEEGGSDTEHGRRPPERDSNIVVLDALMYQETLNAADELGLDKEDFQYS